MRDDDSMNGAARWAEERESRGYGEVEGMLCLAHITDPALLADLEDESISGSCMLCGATGESRTIELEDLMTVFIDTFRYFYAPADELPYDSEDGVYVGPQSTTQDAVWDLASDAFDAAVLDDAIHLLANAIGDEHEWTWWGAGGDPDQIHFEWDRFARAVKHESRFVFLDGDPADPSMGFLFGLRDYVDEKNGLIRTLPAGSAIFRGRLCEEPNAIGKTARHLGPAPVTRAGANRMSPQGISYFYGSSDIETAVAEIAGHGVEPLAVVGRFVTTRDLSVLDLTSPPSMPSHFDRGRRREHKILSFLGSFVTAITAPVIPDGRQHVEYVPTQVVTEYLRRIARVRLDGLVLPSSRTAERTFVLFVDQDGVADAGSSPESRSLRSELLEYQEAPPALTLDSDDVQVVRVLRSYSVEPLFRPSR